MCGLIMIGLARCMAMIFLIFPPDCE